MEGTNTLSSSGVTVVGSDAPSDYHMAPRATAENAAQVAGSAPPSATVALVPVSVTPPPSAAAGVGGATTLKKKRGRPRKYAPDGSATALSPRPISSSAPSPVIDFSAVEKRGKIRPAGSVAKLQQPRVEINEALGNGINSNSPSYILCVCQCVFECTACMSMKLSFICCGQCRHVNEIMYVFLLIESHTQMLLVGCSY